MFKHPVNKQLSLLEGQEFSEWVGMPEFIQEPQEAYATIVVRFESKADLENFAKLIGQKLTKKTKSIWHPQLIRGIHSNKKYVDEP